MDDYIPYGVVIEAESEALKREAQQKHRAWFANPTSVAAREEFARALKRWAETTGNDRALGYAETLLKGAPDERPEVY